MTSPHENCTQHSGIMGRLNLLITLMGLALAGILSLFGITNSSYSRITTRISEIDKTVAITSEQTSRVSETQRHIWERLDKLEGIK